MKKENYTLRQEVLRHMPMGYRDLADVDEIVDKVVERGLRRMMVTLLVAGYIPTKGDKIWLEKVDIRGTEYGWIIMEK